MNTDSVQSDPAAAPDQIALVERLLQSCSALSVTDCSTERHEAADRIEEIERNAEQLAANQCLHDAVVGDDGGTPYCMLKRRFDALCTALRGHSGDTDGYEFGLGRVKFENGAPVSFIWAGQDEIDAAIDAALSGHTSEKTSEPNKQ